MYPLKVVLTNIEARYFLKIEKVKYVYKICITLNVTKANINCYILVDIEEMKIY